MDDCWCIIRHLPPPRQQGLRITSRYTDPAEAFNDCLNSVHPQVKFTRESEEDYKIAFLDVQLTRLPNGILTTQIFRKPSNTNVILKPQSCNDPRIFTASFKGELCHASRLCTSPSQTKKEDGFILDVYEDNGHNQESLQTIADTYIPPTPGSKNKNTVNSTNTQHQTPGPSHI
jgi:hypothetical protein